MPGDHGGDGSGDGVRRRVTLARVLAIAGSDSSGGAGVQADIKTITALGAYAATAITAITVQDTSRVHEVFRLPPALVAAQAACALADPGADAIKTGMLVDAATIAAIAAVLAHHPAIPLVIDPVMVATSGDSLLAPDGIAALRALFPRATVITPNAPEAAALCGFPIATLSDMRRAAAALLAQGAQAVLVKGGHLDTPEMTDLLLTATGEHLFTHPRQPGGGAHGTGCTLASAIATGLAQGLALPDATARAIGYVQAALRAAPSFGAGATLLNHAAACPP